jgi:poly(A) polymerase
MVYTSDEHGVNFADVDPEAVYIIERLRANGFESYIVGGAVRDLILGRKPKDFDIVTGASPSRIKKIFRNARIIGRRFRLVHVYFGPKIFEVSTFRSLKDGPTSNTFGSIEEDVRRRDFSMNALFYDPLKRLVVDYVDGMRDIRRKRVRPIIPLGTIFTDDPVRMIRAVKYAAATGFKLPLPVKWKIKRQSRLLGSISPSRLTEEIFKIIQSPAAAGIVENLEALGLYAYLQPRASALMRGNPAFRARYLKSLSDSDREDAGRALAALIRDYLEDFVNWDAGITETYKTAFLEGRRFVLPMNPPRAELDRGVRLILGEHGMTVKRARLFDRGGIEKAEDPAISPGEPKKKRRRRRRKSPAPEVPIPEDPIKTTITG